MSELLQSADCCAQPCPSPLVQNVPGPQGPAGTNGTNGTNGINAFTALTASFVMPAEGANVTVTVASATWATVGQIVAIGKFGDAAFGNFQVIQVVSGTSLTIKNLEDTGTGAYASNSPPATVFPNGASVSPSGLQGPAGTITSAAGGDLTGTYPNPLLIPVGTATTIGDSTHVSRVTTDGNGRVTAMSAVAIAFPASGTAAALNTGILDGELAPNDGNLTPGDAVFATASGIETKSAADALLALGISGGVGAYILAQNQQATTIDAGSFTSGGANTVPVNTLVQNGGGAASLNAGTSVLTLATGVYRVRASVPAYRVGKFRAYLFNITDNIIEFYGSNGNSDPATVNNALSLINGRLTVSAGPKDYRLMAQCLTTKTTDGFGSAGSFGGAEVYASWELEKEN